jgi:rfaE bifunctional protein nucleotidyltransferase chain/domain
LSLLSLAEAMELRHGKKLVFTNGVFDILHAGHVAYLRQARQLGEILIVGLNTDESARKLGKAPGRPVNTLEDRAAVIGALRFVDGVVSFSEDTPAKIIQALKPEIHVKGGDYDPETMPETPIVRGYGGEIVILPLLRGRSTTEILRKLNEE